MITTAEAKAFLQIDNNNYDSLIDFYIPLVSAEIEVFLNNLIYPLRNIEDEIINSVDIDGEYVCKAFPISNVEVKKDNVLINDGYIEDLETGSVISKKFIGNTDYTVNYTCGYAVADVPKDLKFVALKALKAIFDANTASNSSGGGASEVKSKKIGDFSVSYGGDSNNSNNQYAIIRTVFDNNMDILGNYMRIILF